MLANTFLAIGKGVVGFLGNSSALIADAMESLNDMLASLLVIIGLRYATLPPDENHPYGHGKAEPLVGFAVAVVLVASAVLVAWHSIRSLMEPREAPEAYTLYALAAIVLIKELMYRFVRKKGEQTGSNSLQADAWHHRSDALTSGAAFVGISVALLFGEGYEHADDWAALFACVIILYNAYRMFRPALGEVMDEHKYPELEQAVRDIAEGTAGVHGTEKCYVRKVGLSYYVDLHLWVDGAISVYEGHNIAHEAKDAIRAALPEIADVHIHVEPAAQVPAEFS